MRRAPRDLPHRVCLALPVVLASLACHAGAPASDDATAGPRPNVLFVFSDDHAAAAVSAYGSGLNRTPALDRLAAEGVTFLNAFVTNSICAPSRAVLLTGLHSHLNGVRDNRLPFDGSQTTFPKLLRSAGYQTALIGKWHLKSEPTGFDHWEVLPGQGQYYSPDFHTPTGDVRYPGYATDVITDRALRWLREDRDAARPFLLMVQHKAPHRTWMPGPEELELFADVDLPEPPTLFEDLTLRKRAAREQEMTIGRHMYLSYDLQVPPLDPTAELRGPDRWAAGMLGRMSADERARWDAFFGPRNAAFRAAAPTGDALLRWKYQRYIKDYLRCIAGIDRNVGRLLDELDATGLAANTVVVYASDQGFFLGEHGWFDKRFMYEPSLRFPLLVRWPGVTRPGARPEALVQNLDLAPTLLDACGVAVPEAMQGESLVPLLGGDEPAGWRRSVYYEYFEEGEHNVPPHHGIRTERYKLIRYPASDEWELFDLERDPDEVHDLADDPDHVALMDELRGDLARLRAAALVPADGSAAEVEGAAGR